MTPFFIATAGTTTMNNHDAIALEKARSIIKLSLGGLPGGLPQLLAKVQCEVLEAMGKASQGLASAHNIDTLCTDGQICSESTGALMARLRVAIDEAEHKPGEWAVATYRMGGICSTTGPLTGGECWGSFSYKRDAWLAVAAVQALPELLHRLVQTEAGERSADNEVERLTRENALLGGKVKDLEVQLAEARHNADMLTTRVVILPQEDKRTWVEWNGGDCPLSSDAKAYIRTRDGQVIDSRNSPKGVMGFGWRHTTDHDRVWEIVAYSLIEKDGD